MKDLRSAASYLAALGLAVHWLRPPRGGKPEGRGKAPIDKGWQLRPWQTPDQLRASYRRGVNVGIHTGMVFGARAPVVAVDCDDEKAEAWCRAHLPATPLEARTHAGCHLYYQAGEPVGCRSFKRTWLAIDIRGEGGNIVAPPSIHESGTAYGWTLPVDRSSISALPVFNPGWFPMAVASPPLDSGAIWQPEGGPDALNRAWRYSAKTPGAVQGQGGSLATFNLAVALVRGFALPEDQALQILIGEHNLRCEPPWSEAELRHKVRYAALACRVALGSLLRKEQK